MVRGKGERGEGERYCCPNLMTCMHGISEHVKHPTQSTVQWYFTVRFLYQSILQSYYNLLEQDVVMCVTFALERQYQIITVTSPFYQLVTVDRQIE